MVGGRELVETEIIYIVPDTIATAAPVGAVLCMGWGVRKVFNAAFLLCNTMWNQWRCGCGGGGEGGQSSISLCNYQ